MIVLVEIFGTALEIIFKKMQGPHDLLWFALLGTLSLRSPTLLNMLIVLSPAHSLAHAKGMCWGNEGIIRYGNRGIKMV